MAKKQMLILASASPRRLQLLQQIGLEPDRLLPTNIDETPGKKELPHSMAKRLARTKAEVAARSIARKNDETTEKFVLAADTVVALGRRILPKAELQDEADMCLALLSGRNHRVYTGICLISPKGAVRQKLIETRVRFKRLSREERDSYLASGEWRGKAGGYAIQGLAGSFVVKLVGSYSSVVGLPLEQTASLLTGNGYNLYSKWREHIG